MSSNSNDAIEGAKKLAAYRAVADHFKPEYKYVGIGSGSTIVYVVEAIKATGAEAQQVLYVPTGYQSRQVILKAGLIPVIFDDLPTDVLLDVAFDGADEVDTDMNCIKGGGACLFQEKLVAERAKRFVCVADYRKAQPNLLTNWPTIPIEVAPMAAHIVLQSLIHLGSKDPKVRSGLIEKTGPLKTDQDFFIVDAPFPALLTSKDVKAGSKGEGKGEEGVWEVNTLSDRIKAITGVLDVGIFSGMDGDEAQAQGLKKGGQKPVACYFGMQDGTVMVRTKDGDSS